MSKTVIMMESRDKIAFANGLRGIAAVCVVLSHYFGVFWGSRKVINAMNIPERLFNNSILTFLSNISYPLYVSHPLFGYAFLSVLIYKGIPVYLSLIMITVSIIIISYLLHKYIEKPTHEIGLKLAQSLSTQN